MATHARQQYFADEHSLSKENREFSIADEIQQKIDGIEPGAQVNKIETVKVNGTALVPDANKAVNVEVPEVIDNLYTVDPDNALSAKQGKLLYDYIQNIASRGRFLSNWNSATGLPMTNPSESPYPYKSGDYFIVSNVAGLGGTNYRPDGSSYIIGQASTVTETEDVSVSDFYFYDGTNWLLLVNTARQIAVDSSLSTTSTNPVENRVITNALNNKQNVLTAGNHIDITNNVISAEGFQEELTAGENITIQNICHYNSQGPCPDGFHIPSEAELRGWYNIFIGLGFTMSDVTAFHTYFKVPTAGQISDYQAPRNRYRGSNFYFMANTPARIFAGYSSYVRVTSNVSTRCGYSIRPFKDTSVIPDSSWTTLYDGSSVATGAGIFYNATIGIISMSSDGSTWITIADKNVGATIVYNYGDTLDNNNCGHYFQWGNNYGFVEGSISVSSSGATVDTTGYGPGNYYSSSLFMKGNGTSDRSNPSNSNLWGGDNPTGTWCIKEISAIDTDTKYTAGTGINIDANNVISATATPGQTYTAGNGINISQNNEISADTSVVATQTDVSNKVSKGTNQINGQLFSIEDTYGNSANFGPDYIRIDFNDGTNSGSAGLQRDSLGATANNKISNLTSDSLALKDDLNLTQTTYAEDEITVVDNGYGTSETYQFSGGGNNQIARLKDVKTYTAGNGINISQNNEISADTSVVATKTDLNTKQDTLTAGENTSIENICESDMQGPCPSGFHVPTVGEWNGLINIMKNALSLQYGHQWMQYLHMPYAGQRDCESSNVDRQRIEGFYATSIFDDATPSFSMAFFLLVRAGDTVYIEEYGLPVAMGFSVRGFKNEYITPTSSWTVVQGTLGSAGIFRDQTNGLISITDGTTGYTIMDKNLGATTVFNNGDTLSEANCGKYYQWGNNYGFPRSGSITTSSTQVDASGYGPGNYYSSNTFITTSTSPFDWSSVENKNLRGGVSQGTWCRLTISAEDTKYTAGTGINIDSNNVISATATPGQTYTAGNGINISQNNEISADTSVIATQTDVNNKVNKGTNQINDQLFSIEDTYGNSANFGPDYVRIDFNDGTDSGSAGFQRNGLGATANNKISNLTSDSLALKDDLNLTQTTYAEDEITVVDNGYGTSETYQFSGGGNNQIARLKDVKTYTAGSGINIDANNEISNTLPGPTIAATAPTGTEGALWYDTTNDVLMAHDGTSWKEAGTQMKVLSYGHSTWQDFINAYNENAIVYCRASSNSNPGSGNQGRMAFMAFVSINNTTGLPTEVEFQYYRSRSDHNTAANQLDQVFVYKLTSASGGTWTVTERNTGAKAVAGTGISLGWGSGNMTISADTTTLATQTDLNSKQDTLVSGTNIKTINSNSLLGSGDVTLNDVKSSATAPASPTEGMVWYDTTNDVLKTYDGSNWNECGAGGGGVEVFDITQYGTNGDWTDIITSCENNNTLTIILDYWEDDNVVETGYVKRLVTEYDDGANSGTGRISAMALFNLNGVGSAVPYPKSNKLVATFNTTTKYCTGITQSYTEFVPTNSGSTGNVLTKTAGGYEWAAPTEPTVISGDSGTTYIIKVSDTAPASGTASNIITFVTD